MAAVRTCRPKMVLPTTMSSRETSWTQARLREVIICTPGHLEAGRAPVHAIAGPSSGLRLTGAARSAEERITRRYFVRGPWDVLSMWGCLNDPQKVPARLGAADLGLQSTTSASSAFRRSAESS